MSSRVISILVLFAVCVSAVAVEHKSLAQAGAVKIVRTSYLEKVAERLSQPGVTAEDAAEYANSLLAIHGFDYEAIHHSLRFPLYLAGQLLASFDPKTGAVIDARTTRG
jgi:hypothetical protein